MNVTLDPNDQRHLEELARQSGKEPGELLCELVHEALTERKQNGSASEADGETLTSQQRQAMEELIAELDALPPEGPQDQFSGRDHDEVLYGWKKKA